jgi:hypothetical protein
MSWHSSKKSRSVLEQQKTAAYFLLKLAEIFFATRSTFCFVNVSEKKLKLWIISANVLRSFLGVLFQPPTISYLNFKQEF